MLEHLPAVFLGIHLAAQAVMERLGTRAQRISERAGRRAAAAGEVSAPGDAADGEGPAPGVTVITPVYGVDRFTEACLRSRLEQRYAGPVQHVFSLQDPADPARDLLERLRADHDFETVVNPVRSGLTGKSSNLVYGMGRARHDRLFFCDDDVVLPPGTLARVIAQLEAGCDLVSCLPSYRPRGNLPARIYALYWNLAIHYAWAPVTALGVVRGLWGCAVGLRRGALDAMGGMEELGAYVAEDLEMGRRAHRLGLKTALGPPVAVPAPDMGWGQTRHKLDVLAFVGIHQNPWGRPANAAFFLLYYGYVPAAALAALSGAAGLAAASAFLLGRGLLMGRLLVLAGDRFRIPWEYPVMDLMHAASMVRVGVTGKVRWGNHVYRARRDARLSEVD